MRAEASIWQRTRQTATVARGLARSGHLVRALHRGAPPVNLTVTVQAVLSWVDRAFDASGGDGGASASYDLVDGWALPYPEITGYLIPTLLAHGAKDRAYRAGRWLAETRLASGAICRKQWFPGNTTPSVFNTGQVIDGWCALARHGGDDEWLALARQAADWMLAQQEADGSWRHFALNDIPHTYYARAAAPLADLAGLTSDQRYADAARRHLDWVVAQQDADGWVDHAGWTATDVPTTHTIAYVLEGLVVGGLALGDARYGQAAAKAADALRQLYRERGYLPGVLGRQWRSPARWRCVTGDAQVALVWCRLAKVTGDAEYRRDAGRLAEDIRRTIEVREDWPEVSGALPGSFPRWGDYDAYAYPTHAAKFMLDLIGALNE